MIQQNNPETADMFRCLTVKQPFADALITPAYTDANGVTFGEKSIELRSRPLKYRGDVLICSSQKGVGHTERNGITVGVAELYDIKPVEQFTEKDWMCTRVSRENWQSIKKGWGWLFRNPRPVVELPIKGKLGLWWMAAPKDSIIEYPRAVQLDANAWYKIMADNYDKLAFPLPPKK